MQFPPPPSFSTIYRCAERVVITGAGIVTALGFCWRVNAEGFRAGRSAFRPVTRFDVSPQRAKIAAEVDLPDELPANRLSRKIVRRLDYAAVLLHAAHEAWTPRPVEGRRTICRLSWGTTSGEMTFGERYLQQAIGTPETRRRQPTRIVHYQVQQQGINLCDAFGFHGPLTIISNACASGANAIGHAWDLVRNGRANKVLTEVMTRSASSLLPDSDSASGAAADIVLPV